MKIVLVNDYKELIGGAEVYMLLLQKELKKRGHEVTLFTSDITKEEYISTIQQPTMGDLLKRMWNGNSYNQMRKLLDIFKPDIVHIHGLFNELSPSVLWATRAIPTMMTVHNDQLVSALPIQKIGRSCRQLVCSGCIHCVGIKGMIYEKIRRHIYAVLFLQIKHYIAPSVYMKSLLEAHNFGPVIQIYNGVAPIAHTKVSSYTNILYVGRLTEEKGIRYLVAAMPIILQTHPEARLTIVGDGPQKKELYEEVHALGIEKSVTFLPSLSRREVIDQYAKATVVCIPSINYDNLPTVGIEALYAGRPLVGTNIGGIPELIADGYNGYLVDPGDTPSLAKKLRQLLSDKHKIDLWSKHSREKSNVFDIDTHVNKIVNLYKESKK